MELEEIHTLALSPAVAASFAALWSDDDKISVITEKGLHVMAGADKRWKGMQEYCKTRLTFFKGTFEKAVCCMWLIFLLQTVPLVAGGNITSSVFGLVTGVRPAAFGDFNSDELTDLFVIRGKKKNTMEIMLAREQEPLFQAGHGLSCMYSDMHITSVVPGNFDGDAHLDLLVTALNKTDPHSPTHIFISWGGVNHINCSNVTAMYKMKNQPLVLDYNHDMVVDLFGENVEGNRTFVVFNANRSIPPQLVPMMPAERSKDPLRVPHSHAFLDLNRDFTSDLLLSTKVGFELWLANKNGELALNGTIELPVGLTTEQIGQSLFLDLELTGEMYHLLPVCFDGFKDCLPCRNSTLFAYVNGKWHNLNPDLRDGTGQVWGFYRCSGHPYTDTVTLRGGDFNMDGYPDILATLMKNSHSKVFLLENVESLSGSLSRTYTIHGDSLASMNNDTTMAAFYDLYQDGVLDVILYGPDTVQAFRNTLDYDANFLKVMVLTGTDRGGNLPGPGISCRTTTQEGYPRLALTTQLPQSAHFSLGLPYTIFGLGRTPKFVDTLTVGIAGRSKPWTQIIPNSQMVVIPSPLDQTSKWRAQLFITPSKMILMSAVALTGTCGLIIAIIGALYWKEKREDRIEKLQEAHRFHFDAM
ncbi:T-cell immunomodulatory protein [Cryptotermes secundus]|nr:T-cell immunomodulatory protein [Cryptotermes secundus]